MRTATSLASLGDLRTGTPSRRPTRFARWRCGRPEITFRLRSQREADLVSITTRTGIAQTIRSRDDASASRRATDRGRDSWPADPDECLPKGFRHRHGRSSGKPTSRRASAPRAPHDSIYSPGGWTWHDPRARPPRPTATTRLPTPRDLHQGPAWASSAFVSKRSNVWRIATKSGQGNDVLGFFSPVPIPIETLPTRSPSGSQKDR